MTTRRGAFTLLEVLLVITLLGFLASFLWPVFGSATDAPQLDESVQRVKALVAMCRAEAMNESRRYRLTFQLDGSLRLSRQLDPVAAPQVYVKVKRDWAALPFVLEEVWVESVLPLPDGPPPLVVEEDYISFYDEAELELEPIPVQELEEPFALDFRPDGSCPSLRWVMRDRRGRGVRLTLDGRLGRLDVEPVARVPAEEVQRPPELLEDEEQPDEPVDLEDFR